MRFRFSYLANFQIVFSFKRPLSFYSSVKAQQSFIRMFYWQTDVLHLSREYYIILIIELVAARVEPRPSFKMQLGQLLVLGDIALFLAIDNQ